jgi:hypothetical protein
LGPAASGLGTPFCRAPQLAVLVGWRSWKTLALQAKFPLRERRKLLVFCRLLPDGAGVDPAREKILLSRMDMS